MAEPVPVQSAEVSDTGVHLPGAKPAEGHSAMDLIGSLLSLPPRAQKRRRGSRFKAEPQQPATEEEGKEGADVAHPAQPSAAASTRVDRPWRERKFEYLDHTADIQLHGWGSTLEEAMEQTVLSMFSYMTDLTRVEVDPSRTDSFRVSGHDADSLLFNLLDELLYRFLTNEWVIRDVRVDELDMERFTLRVTGWGEGFTLEKHTQGTEVKAITYSAMQIFVKGKRLEGGNEKAREAAPAASPAAAAPAAAAAEPAPGDAVAPPAESGVVVDDASCADCPGDAPLSDAQVAARATHGADIYVIVDI